MGNNVLNLINHLQHVGIPVTNIAVSEKFYYRLGFEVVMLSSFISKGDTGTCVMMKNKNIIIELYQMPPKQLAEIKTRKDGRIDHIAFDVDDIDSAFALLKEEGFDIIENEPVALSFWKKGCRYFNISGPDGERLEFNQILK
jgi:catechol 2,3-dioxygenase-like lactoylglutathione lyase family enzyme